MATTTDLGRGAARDEAVVPERIISADSHVVPLPTFWAEYLPSAFRDRAPRVESTPEGDFTVFEGRRTPVMAINSNAGKQDEGGFEYERFEEQLAGGHDPVARLVDMDRDGVEAEVIYGGGPLTTEDWDLFLASHYAYNDWLADFCATAPSRLYGVAYIPTHTVEAAVAEVRRTRARGLRSTLLPATPHAGGLWFERTWDPLWEALVETRMPLGLHVSFGFARRMRFEGGPAFLVDLAMTKLEMAQPIAELVFGGVLHRFPDLDVVSVEANVGWIPFLAEYMDHAFRYHRYWNDPGLGELPSHYLHRQVYATFIEDAVGVREREAIGVRNLMWSTDYPHGESTWPHSREVAARLFAGVPADEVAQIVHGNVKRLYGM